ncbi:hypothetical protein G6O67_000112 [Ophiocordyceps sinensis]|uniref:Uncharacterized protein n=1 Tax=Ophiocordyceps sinensis TaxID=72228 RepID=A0A8H4PYB1_9HYPO|nr:hypothetical protein G6O67_000112 [Ophiocordyceps sinensis]
MVTSRPGGYELCGLDEVNSEPGSNHVDRSPGPRAPRPRWKSPRLLAISAGAVLVLFSLLWITHSNVAKVAKDVPAALDELQGKPAPGPDLGPTAGASPARVFASIVAGNVQAPYEVLDAVLHPERKALVSPNGEWRLQLADDGELILQTYLDATWNPVWWAHSGAYRRKSAATGTPYVAVDAGGAVRVLVMATGADGDAVADGRWDSSTLRRCSSVEGDAITSEMPAPQSMALANDGRLLVFNRESRLSCVLYDDTSDQHPTLHQSVDFTVADVEQPDPEHDQWPMFQNSDKLSNLQLRGMLERDLAKGNQSLRLGRQHLQTTFNTAIVLPTYRGHADFCVKFLRSMIRHCVDCHQWQINLILTTEDVDQFRSALFEAGNESVGYYLPGLRIVEYEAMQFEYYGPEIDVAGITKGMNMFLLQDFKKMHGCLNTGKRHCLLLDSEGIMLRTTWLADIVSEYLENPFVIHTPESRNGSSHPIPWSTPCGDMLKIDNFSDAGWLLEYYLWVFDSRVYAEVARAYAQAWPQLQGNPQELFMEVCYFAYIWAKKGPVEGPEYRFITSKRLLGQRLWDLMWPRRVYEKGADPESRVDARGLSIIEDVRAWLEWFPDLLPPVAQVWERNQMRLFRP